MHHDAGPAGWWLAAVENRGRRWAQAVYARTKGRTPWPANGGAILVHAARALADMLPTTEEGREMLRVCYEAAKAHYEVLARK